MNKEQTRILECKIIIVLSEFFNYETDVILSAFFRLDKDYSKLILLLNKSKSQHDFIKLVEIEGINIF
jgi:hypothetical protein